MYFGTVSDQAEAGRLRHHFFMQTVPIIGTLTVRSRCETVVLGPVSRAAIEVWLQRVHGVSERDASIAASLAAGRPGRVHPVQPERRVPS